MELDILAALQAYADSGVAPLHMPGHKRNGTMLSPALPWQLDITEIPGFDNLHAPQDLLLHAMQRARDLYATRHTFFLVNGATGGLLAAIRAMTHRGDHVLIARGSHRAVYHALELCALRPVYLVPPIDEASGVAGSIPPAQIEQALAENPQITLCILTSPTYEGVLSDIQSIARLLHARNIPLLVDEAHGAHLGLSNEFPRSAAALGADAVVHSLHKTLPSLTQTGLLHVLSDRVNIDEVARQLAIFQTSSPSYVLMASMDRCIGLMANRGVALLAALRARIEHFHTQTQALKHLRVLNGSPVFYAQDVSKIVVVTRGSDMTGDELMRALRERGFEMELMMRDYALALVSICDDDAVFTRFADALIDIDAGLRPATPRPIRPLPKPQVRLTIDEALLLPGESVALHDAVGRIAQEYVWAYPPGAPLLAPGELVLPAFVDAANDYGVQLHSTCGQMPRALRVCIE